jgi:hypothetical protein
MNRRGEVDRTTTKLDTARRNRCGDLRHTTGMRAMRQGATERSTRRADLHFRVHLLRDMHRRRAGRHLPKLRWRPAGATHPSGQTAGEVPHQGGTRASPIRRALGRAAREYALTAGKCSLTAHCHPEMVLPLPTALIRDIIRNHTGDSHDKTAFLAGFTA